MAKKVLVIDNKIDMIADHFDYLMECWDKKEIKVKKKADGTTFSTLSLDPDEYGILWFNSRDYTNLIGNVERFIFPEHKRVLGLQIGYGVDYEVVVMQGNKLIEKLGLTSDESVYVKIKVDETSDQFALFTSLKNDLKLLSRIQLDFGGSEVSVQKSITLASKASACASKVGCRVNSCCLGIFNEKNRYIGSEPCVSAFTMQEMLGTAMVKKPDSFNVGVCMCHKYINFSGSGEVYDEKHHKMRKEKNVSKRGY